MGVVFRGVLFGLGDTLVDTRAAADLAASMRLVCYDPQSEALLP
jgi:hypothetical protein